MNVSRDQDDKDDLDTARWWQRGIIYQIYPRSFMDADGDGVGDLPGIVQRLPYVAALGVDAIWISPFYPSPMADFGYDVADYTNVHPLFGTLDDFDRLVVSAHELGLRVLVDFVPNHTSNAHPWFAASRASRESAQRDWYVWRDAAPDGGPPNNWRAVFGGSAWEWDEATQQYYYHAFLKEQPDLNWRNPDVRAAMLDVLRFWLRRGVDGFRVDAIHHLFEDVDLRDNPPNPDWRPALGSYAEQRHVYSLDQPEVHEAIAEMRRVLDEYGDTVMVSEAYLPVERIMRYYGDGAGAQLPFNFLLLELPWNAGEIARAIASYEAALPDGAWPNWVLGNHDRSRVASRVGDAQARVAAMLLLTLRGTPTLYQGDELGQRDVPIPPALVQDPWELNMPGLGYGRDPARTPMPWSAAPNAGFTTGTPWLPVGDDVGRINVETEQGNSTSMLTLHQRLITLRRAEPALAIGDWSAIEGGTGVGDDVLAYIRHHGGRRFLVLLNLAGRGHEIALPALAAGGRVVLSTHLDRDEAIDHGAPVSLRPDEGIVIQMSDAQ